MRLSISHFYPQVSALLVLAVSLAGSCITAFAGEVVLAWDAKTEPEIVGYKIYYQGITHSDLRSIDVGNVTTYTVTGLDPDTYGFCVTAYDTSGNETGGSNIVSTTLSPPMYGFRDALSQRGRAWLAGLYSHSRSLSENRRCSPPAPKDNDSPVACRLRNGDRFLPRFAWPSNIHSHACITCPSPEPHIRHKVHAYLT